jgi:hypothetical protein
MYLQWDINKTKCGMAVGIAFKKILTALKPFEKLEDLDHLFQQAGWPWGVQVPKVGRMICLSI